MEHPLDVPLRQIDIPFCVDVSYRLRELEQRLNRHQYTEIVVGRGCIK